MRLVARIAAAATVAAVPAMAGCARGPSSSGSAAPAAATAPVLEEQTSGTTALLQAVSAVNDRVVWVSGHRATWARTTDGGATWQAGAMTGADSALEFRDVHALSADVAWLLAAGPGDRSRIHHTRDGGRTWTLQFRNTDSAAFYDCFDFWDARRGVVVSDAVNGRLVIRVTADGGATWEPVAAAGIPPAHPGEGAFAASGTCLVARPGGLAWIATGAEAGARVYATRDYGRTWTFTETPIVHGQASGGAALAFRDARRGLAAGGRLGAPRDTSNHVAVTGDGGASWTLAGRPPFAGAVYGAAWARAGDTYAAVGPGGLAVTFDGGASWRQLSASAYWAVGFGSPGAGWATGPRGRITKVSRE